MPPQTLDLFGTTNAGRHPPPPSFVYHHGQSGPPPPMMLATAPPPQQSTPILDHQPTYRPQPTSNSSAGGGGDVFAPFVVQRPPPVGGTGSAFAAGGKPAQATGAPPSGATAFLLSSDSVASGLSLFTQPPPTLARQVWSRSCLLFCLVFQNINFLPAWCVCIRPTQPAADSATKHRSTTASNAAVCPANRWC